MTNDALLISDISSGLHLADDGIWYAKSNEALSYPVIGNDSCFTVEDDSFWFKHRNRCIAALIEKYADQSHSPLFDIGGGNGAVSAGLAKRGISSILVEPGFSGARNARSRGLKNIICATTLGAGFSIESLPSVGLFDVVEHIQDDTAFMDHIFNLIRPGGLVFLTVPAYSWLWSEADDAAGHFRRYNRKSSVNLIQSSGFDLKFFSYFFAILPLPSLMLRTLPYRLGILSSKKKESHENPEKDHMTHQGIASKVVDKLLSWEVDRLRHGKSIGIGGSCILVSARTKTLNLAPMTRYLINRSSFFARYAPGLRTEERFLFNCVLIGDI